MYWCLTEDQFPGRHRCSVKDVITSILIVKKPSVAESQTGTVMARGNKQGEVKLAFKLRSPEPCSRPAAPSFSQLLPPTAQLREVRHRSTGMGGPLGSVPGGQQVAVWKGRGSSCCDTGGGPPAKEGRRSVDLGHTGGEGRQGVRYLSSSSYLPSGPQTASCSCPCPTPGCLSPEHPVCRSLEG